MAKLRAKLDRYVSVLGSGTALTRIQIIIIKKCCRIPNPLRGTHTHSSNSTHCVCVCTESIYDIYANYANAPRVPQCVCRDIVLTAQRDPWRRHTRRMRNICYSRFIFRHKTDALALATGLAGTPDFLSKITKQIFCCFSCQWGREGRKISVGKRCWSGKSMENKNAAINKIRTNWEVEVPCRGCNDNCIHHFFPALLNLSSLKP